MAPEEDVIKVEKKPKKSKKGLIIAVLVLFFVFLIILGAVWFALRTGLLGDLMADAGERRTAPRGPVDVERAPDYLFEMPEILVNLNDGGTRSRFLSIKFYIGYDNGKLEAKLDQRMPEIRDNVLKVLWGVSGDEILTVEGKEHLRNELRHTIQEMFWEDDILGIYFWHVMVQ